MNNFRKLETDSSKPRLVAKEVKQNPQRWRRAFNDIRPPPVKSQTVGDPFALVESKPFVFKSPTEDRPMYKPISDFIPEKYKDFAEGRVSPAKSSTIGAKTMLKPPVQFGVPEVKSSSQVGTSIFKGSNPFGASMFKSNIEFRAPTKTSAETRLSVQKTSSQRRLSPSPTNRERERDASPNRITLRTELQTVDFDKDLDELMSRAANTSEDRYRILDSRDKILRKMNPKVKVRVEFAVRLEGTCQDMCPEKERYMREVQRRLSSFECLQSRDCEVDHRLAIKLYSRSSADQEEPLPHELRPITSLHLTFNYLLHNVIDRIENEGENLADWYFFIWDRTRSIRKDMTQQQLGDTDAVLLMENCTRFHIFCSSRLCELDRHAFDPKLNDENLMKCLQSLEHMYSDLALKGVRCPNEPEFRAYQVIMNLNQGDIIWEIQRRPDWILKSEPVTHALKIYVALSDKNSVRFFRLVESSSFMTSCILHRYFFQARTTALRIYLKTFSLKSGVSLSTTEMKRLLGFGDGMENFETFRHFCLSHGMTAVTKTTMTMNNRNEFDQPDILIINREYTLIESKLEVSVSEAINGGPLGKNPLETYIPQSSFEEDGYFKRDLVEAMKKLKPSQNNASEKIFSNSPQTSFLKGSITFQSPRTAKHLNSKRTGEIPKPPSDPRMESELPSRYTNIPKKSLFPVPAAKTTPPINFSFTSSTVDAALRKAKNDASAKKVTTEVSSVTLNKVVDAVVSEEVKKEASVALVEHMRQVAREGAQRSVGVSVYSHIESRVISDLVASVAVEELAKAKSFQLIGVTMENELRELVVSEFITEIAQDIFNQKKFEHLQKLEKVGEICKRINLRNWFEIWKDVTHERKWERSQRIERQKWNIENFPPILVSQLSPETILSEWSGFITTVNKVPHDSPRFDLVERSMELRHSFENHVKEFRPSIIHHLVTPLIHLLSARPHIPRICTQFHPPVAINIVLWSGFGPWDHLANWTWTSFSADCVPLTDPNFITHALPIRERSPSYLTFQKCTEQIRVSIDTWAVLFFYQSPPDLVHLRTYLNRQSYVPVVVFNGTNQSEGEIRQKLGLNSSRNSIIHENILVIGMNKNQIVDNIPALVNGLHWITQTVEIGPPLEPPVILLPLQDFAKALFRETFQRRSKRLLCPKQLFQVHNDLTMGIAQLVESSKTLGVLKKWPGKATKLLIQKSCKFIRFSHEEGKLGVVIQNMATLQKVLQIPQPEELIEKFHQRQLWSMDNVKEGFREFVALLTQDFEVSDELRTRLNYFLSAEWANPTVNLWREFLTLCQECVLEKLSTFNFSSYQVLVDLFDLQKLETPQQSSQNCSVCSNFGKKRKLQFDDLSSFISPNVKTVCKGSQEQSREFLQEMKELLKDMKDEREILEASFSTCDLEAL